jgi:hypothetical protein
VTLTNLTVRNGNVAGSGGGIENNGMLSIRACAVSNNTASVDGGGIDNLSSATLNILNSAITDNTTGEWGGGISTYEATLNIANSTLSGNSAGDHGGGIVAHGAGHSTNLTFVSVTNNTADTDNDGDYGGGVCNGGGPFINIKNSLVAGNSVVSNVGGPDCYTDQFNSSGFNLIGDNTDCSGAFPEGNPNGNNDYVGTGANPMDPRLQGLTGNPAHYPLQADSPAVAKVPPAQCTYISSGTNPFFGDGDPVISDQRGQARPEPAPDSDIGAYESIPVYIPGLTDLGKVCFILLLFILGIKTIQRKKRKAIRRI